MAVEYIGQGAPDGTCLGRDDSELLGFYGTAPVAQPATISAVTTATITSVTTTAATSTTDAWGYSTSTQADAIVTAVNALITREALANTQGNAAAAALVTLGLIAAS